MLLKLLSPKSPTTEKTAAASRVAKDRTSQASPRVKIKTQTLPRVDNNQQSRQKL